MLRFGQTQEPGRHHAVVHGRNAAGDPEGGGQIKYRFCRWPTDFLASAEGSLFPWVFNAPATYWDGASAFIRHVADVEGGFDKLKGKKIGLVHLDAPYMVGEPIPLLQALALGLRLRA